MINELIKKAEDKNIVIQVFNTNIKNTWVETFNSKVSNYNISENSNYQIEALYKDKMISLSYNSLDDVDMIINKILYLYELSDNKDLGEFARPIEVREKLTNSIQFDLDLVIKFLTGLNKLKKKYSVLKNISTSFSCESKKIQILNKNIVLKDNYEYLNIYVEVVVKDNKKAETNYFHLYTNKFDEEEIANKTISLIEETIIKLDASSIKTKKQNVLLTNECTYEILKAFNSMFFAKNIRLGTSILKDKFNKKVFNDKLTIVEAPTNENMIVNILFDTEGTKTYYKEIIKNGVFKTKLYDNQEANIEKTISTGNAHGVTNMYIIPGNKSFEELIKENKNGIIIDDIQGLHSGINVITGDFSVQCSGFKVKNGIKDSPIKMFIMSSNIVEILNNIEEIGNDLEFFESNGGSPSLLIKNIDIAGSEK